MTFAEYLDARRVTVDSALNTFLPRPPKVPQVVYDAMRYSLDAGGKRLRPMLVLAAAEGTAQACGGSEAAARDLEVSGGGLEQAFLQLTGPQS